METMGDLYWKIACLSVQKKLLLFLLNTEKDRVDKRDVWDLVSDMEEKNPPSHHPRADSAIAELSEELTSWSITRRRAANLIAKDVITTIDENDAEEIPDGAVWMRFPRKRGAQSVSLPEKANLQVSSIQATPTHPTATIIAPRAVNTPILDENPLDVSERIVGAVRGKKHASKRDATELRLVHGCIRDVDAHRYIHTVRAHYAAVSSRAPPDEVLAEALSPIDAVLVFLAGMRVPPVAMRGLNAEDVYALLRRCRPAHVRRLFLEPIDTRALAFAVSSPLLTMCPLDDLLRWALDFDAPECSYFARFEEFQKSDEFFVAHRVDRTGVLWKCDRGMRGVALHLAQSILAYIRTIFQILAPHVADAMAGQAAHPDGDAFATPRLFMLMKNALMCTRGKIAAVLCGAVGHVHPRRASRQDRWFETKEPNDIDDEVGEREILRSFYPAHTNEQLTFLFNKLVNY